VARDRGWDLWIVVPVAAAAALLVYGFLVLCMPRRDEIEQIR